MDQNSINMLKSIHKKAKNKYKEYLKGKRVALVGPGWHTKNTNQHDLIDSYDIVVRINDGIGLAETYPEDLGERTDILYCTLGDRYFKKITYFKSKVYREAGVKLKVRKKLFTKKNIENYNKFLKWIVITHAIKHPSNVKRLAKMIKNTTISINIVKRDIFEKMQESMGSSLSAGIVTIYDLLQYKIKELYITGFTFYDRKTTVVTNNKINRSAYPRGLVTKKFVGHNSKKEVRFFTKLSKKDNRITCDNVLDKIVKNN